MPHIAARDGVRLYYEEAGSGTPVIFVHEYAGDYRTWEPQMRYFSRAHRCITYSQRGYPPSDVPTEAARYSQDIARDDVIALMDALKIEARRISSAIRWAPTRRCMSASMHRSAAFRSWLPAAARDRARMRKSVEEMKALAAEIGKMFADERHRGGGGEICRRADAPAAEEQGPARLRRIRAHAGRPFRRRSRADHAQSAGQAADAVGDGGGAEEIFRAAAGHCRRRGRVVRRRQRLSQAARCRPPACW